LLLHLIADVIAYAALLHCNVNADKLLAEGSIDTSQDNYGDIVTAPTAAPLTAAAQQQSAPVAVAVAAAIQHQSKHNNNDDDDVLDESYGLGDDFEVDELDS
jgi:hypothetical protein